MGCSWKYGLYRHGFIKL